MSLPVGTVVGMIGVNPQIPPRGWLYCNGGSFNGLEYPELAKLLGTNTLPKLAGLTLMGASLPEDSYPASSLGDRHKKYQNPDGTYGKPEHALSMEQMPSHQHFGFGESSSSWPYGTQGVNNQMGSRGGWDFDNYLYGTTFAGGSKKISASAEPNDSFAVIQPTYAIYFFIFAGSPDVGAKG